jgi:putative heme-binding domain-containing protein
LTTDAGARFFLKNVSTPELLKMKRTRPVYLEMLFRKGLLDESRKEALSGLARLEHKSELPVLLQAIQSQEERAEAHDDGAVLDLVRLLTSRSPAELKGLRTELAQMATSAKLPISRQLGFVALIAADGTADKAWEMAAKSITALKDLLNALPLLRDPAARASLYPKVEPLLHGLPPELASAPGKGKATLGRYVRIELVGRRTLTLAEVEVYSDGRNVARQGKASQKNTAYGGDAQRAIDGNTSGDFGAGSQTHTEEGTQDPWWEVDLGSDVPIDTIVIYNRTDGNLGQRLKDFTLKILDSHRALVFQVDHQPAPAVKATISVGGSSPEEVIRRAAMTALTYVRGQEVPTFKTLAAFIRAGIDRPAAIQALQRIPSTFWPTEEARPLLDSLLAAIPKIPVQDRATPAALDTLQLADALVALLPAAEAKQIRKDLGELGVRVLRLGTVPDQMLFDKERIVVKAGKPVEFLFENNDIMPHNFVVIQPGSLEEIGLLGEASATQPGAAERNYVPASTKILLSSRLLQPRDGQKLSFTAPAQPGVYPYVCTYPGHWRRMFGALYVVEDLDQYLAEPEAYLAKHPLPIADPLLKYNRPRKEWKFEDLAADVAALAKGRSYANGKQMFQVANCMACHKVQGIGTDMGPDLTKLEAKTQNTDILRDILEPSFKINEKYYSYIFEMQDGKQITGLILEETPEVVKVIENPLLKAQPVVLKKADIAERKKSMTSLMPKGLLDKLTREEILDLVAYIAARADDHHTFFQGGAHGHDHGGGH